MLNILLDPEVQKFVSQHEGEDEKKILLKYKTILNVPAPLVVNQIIGRRKAWSKIPAFYAAKNILYPPGLNLEQSSSESTATFKAALLRELRPDKNKTLADLTGGFGVDSFFLSSYFEKVSLVEPNPELIEITRHNLRQLGRTNIRFYNTTAESFLENASSDFDWIYLDPSRRDANNNKVFKLGNCTPNAPALMSALLKRTGNVLIKSSPLLDLKLGAAELNHVTNIVVVSVDNECKEVLFICSVHGADHPLITAVDIHGDTRKAISFTWPEERDAVVEYSGPKKFLYEPSASLLKAGAFKILAQRFRLFKLHPSTHLYTSDSLVHDFPGRVFSVDAEVKPEAKILNISFPEGKANITTRNYPLTVAELKKKTGLKDGGEKFLIGFTSKEKKYLVAASRLQ